LPGTKLFRRVHIFVNLLMRVILFYQTWSGRSPVEEFILNLPKPEQEKITAVFDLVRESDRVPSKYLKKLVGTDQLWEVRVDYRGKAFRMLGFFDGSRLIVLVGAFSKKSEQTPVSEIRTAEERRRDYYRRKG
jgi:phage-related protein